MSEDGAHSVGELARVPSLVLQGDGGDVERPLVLRGAQLLFHPVVLQPGDAGYGIAAGRRARCFKILTRRQEKVFAELAVQLRHLLDSVALVLLQGHRLGLVLGRVFHLDRHVAPLAGRGGARVGAGVGQTHFLNAQTKKTKYFVYNLSFHNMYVLEMTRINNIIIENF